jgi:hypothetical protein
VLNFDERYRLNSIKEVDEKRLSYNDMSEGFFTEKAGDLSSVMKDQQSFADDE